MNYKVNIRPAKKIIIIKRKDFTCEDCRFYTNYCVSDVELAYPKRIRTQKNLGSPFLQLVIQLNNLGLNQPLYVGFGISSDSDKIVKGFFFKSLSSIPIQPPEIRHVFYLI
jgi:hypothetical protein